MYRTRQHHKANSLLPQTDKCPFCNLDDQTLNPVPRRTLRQTEHALVVSASFPYKNWELHDVLEHLMILPKRHVTQMSQLTKTERLDIMGLFSKYEAKGYSMYARSQQNSRRSVNHVHIHLIKIGSKPPRIGIYLKKPYVHIKL